MKPELEELLNRVRKRYEELPEGSCDKTDLLSHLDSLSKWNNEPMDYSEMTNVEFPPTLNVAHAVCHPQCGVQEFIVDGSTQRCQKCGGLMFRGDVKQYNLSTIS